MTFLDRHLENLALFFLLFINLYNYIKLFIWVPGYFAADFTEKLDVFC